MSRPRWQLRDAAVGYASRGIPVLPLHYPLPDHGNLHAVTGNQPLLAPAVRTRCSCRDPGCGQPAKHPLGALVPHGVKDATCNRARVLAWWTRHPHANIGLACGHRFDVLDVDGPAGTRAIQELAATHGLASSGPLVRTGGGGWHSYLAPPASAMSTRPGWSMWTGGGVAATWLPHPATTPRAVPTSGSPAVISMHHWPRSRHRCERDWNAKRSSNPPVR